MVQLRYPLRQIHHLPVFFSDELATTAVDSSVAEPGEESLFDTDNHYKINDKGSATLKLNQNAKTATITMKKRC